MKNSLRVSVLPVVVVVAGVGLLSLSGSVRVLFISEAME